MSFPLPPISLSLASLLLWVTSGGWKVDIMGIESHYINDTFSPNTKKINNRKKQKEEQA